ncbi:MAG: 2-amino-4-hydroxy-6-hydroxymethyldihydropteridine diphosphokinase [Gaiellaceae bacterium]
MTRAYVGLGANLGDRESTIRRALVLLGDRPGVEILLVSTLRETEPVGFVDQPSFLNGVAMVETTLTPESLLAELLEVELELGRERSGPRYGPRTIDLDLLLQGDLSVQVPGLRVPHPRLHERAFALEPLVELDPNIRIPGRGTVSEALARLHSQA